MSLHSLSWPACLAQMCMLATLTILGSQCILATLSHKDHGIAPIMSLWMTHFLDMFGEHVRNECCETEPHQCHAAFVSGSVYPVGMCDAWQHI